MQAPEGLVEVGADGLELLLERHHAGHKVVEGLVTIAEDDGFAHKGFAGIFAERPAGALPAELFDGLEFFVGHSDGEPLCSGWLFLFHAFVVFFLQNVVLRFGGFWPCHIPRVTLVHLAAVGG